MITLWLFNIAMGNGPFIDGLPFLKMGGSFHGYVTNNQMVYYPVYWRLSLYIMGIPFLTNQ